MFVLNYWLREFLLSAFANRFELSCEPEQLMLFYYKISLVLLVKMRILNDSHLFYILPSNQGVFCNSAEPFGLTAYVLNIIVVHKFVNKHFLMRGRQHITSSKTDGR